MKNRVKQGLSIASVCAPVLLCGCSAPLNPSIFLPVGNHQFLSMTSSDTQQSAYQWAVKNATLKCKSNGNRSLRVLNASNEYTGPSQKQKMESHVISDIESIASLGILGHHHSHSDKDNHVKLTFRCIVPHPQ